MSPAQKRLSIAAAAAMKLAPAQKLPTAAPADKSKSKKAAPKAVAKMTSRPSSAKPSVSPSAKPSDAPLAPVTNAGSASGVGKVAKLVKPKQGRVVKVKASAKILTVVTEKVGAEMAGGGNASTNESGAGQRTPSGGKRVNAALPTKVTVLRYSQDL